MLTAYINNNWIYGFLCFGAYCLQLISFMLKCKWLKILIDFQEEKTHERFICCTRKNKH